MKLGINKQFIPLAFNLTKVNFLKELIHTQTEYGLYKRISGNIFMKQSFIKNTRSDFLDHWKEVNADSETSFDKKIIKLQLFHEMAEMTQSTFFIVNLPEMRFETMSQSAFTSHNPNEYLKNGFDYTLEQFDSDFLKMAYESYTHIFNAWDKATPELRCKVEVYRDMLHHNGNKKDPGHVRILVKIKPIALYKNANVSLIFDSANNIVH